MAFLGLVVGGLGLGYWGYLAVRERLDAVVEDFGVGGPVRLAVLCAGAAQSPKLVRSSQRPLLELLLSLVLLILRLCEARGHGEYRPR